jgi:DNA-binding CsgD family transcriptional regulator
MTSVRERDVRLLLEVIGEAGAHRSVSAFRVGILPSLRRLVTCDVATYNEVELGRRALSLADPQDALEVLPDPTGVLARYGGQNPLIRHLAETRDGRARMLSDFITRAELHRLDLYREAYRVLGVEYQIALGFPSQPSLVIGVALSRGRRDFSERDRRLLDLARPQLVQAYRNVAAYARVQATLRSLARGLGERGEGIVALARDGAIEYLSPVARTLLEERFPDWTARRGRLPAELDAVRAAGAPTAAVTGGLVARLVRGRATDEPDALLLEARADPLPTHAVEAIGLTRRQAEVLRLVALGRSTPQVAARLNITVATTRKHLEHVYARLGVTSRAAAVATAWAGVEMTASAP